MNNAGLPVDYVWTDSNGVKHTNTFEIKEGDAAFDLNTPGNSVKGNYTWKSEWYLDSAGKTLGDISTIANGVQKTIYGKWVSTINYYYNGEGGIDGVTEVIKGNEWNTPSSEWQNSPYSFRKWWTNSEFIGTNYNEKEVIVPVGNMNLYAKWVSVVTWTFDGVSGDGIEGDGAIEVLKGQQMRVPSLGDYYKNHPWGSSPGYYTWRGFYTSKESTDWLCDASETGIDRFYTPTGNIDMIWKWTSLVFFETNGVGQPINNLEVVKDSSISSVGSLPVLSDSNYTFRGWYLEPDFRTQVDSNYVPRGQTTLYAKWVSVITIDLDVELSGNILGSFKTNYNGQNSYEVIKGQKFNPGFALSSYYFRSTMGNNIDYLSCKNEWATGHDGAGTRIPVDGSYTPTGNITIYPIWYATVTYMNPYASDPVFARIERYETYGSVEVVKGQSTVLPTMPDI